MFCLKLHLLNSSDLDKDLSFLLFLENVADFVTFSPFAQEYEEAKIPNFFFNSLG